MSEFNPEIDRRTLLKTGAVLTAKVLTQKAAPLLESPVAQLVAATSMAAAAHMMLTPRSAEAAAAIVKVQDFIDPHDGRTWRVSKRVPWGDANWYPLDQNTADNIYGLPTMYDPRPWVGPLATYDQEFSKVYGFNPNARQWLLDNLGNLISDPGSDGFCHAQASAAIFEADPGEAWKRGLLMAYYGPTAYVALSSDNQDNINKIIQRFLTDHELFVIEDPMGGEGRWFHAAYAATTDGQKITVKNFALKDMDIESSEIRWAHLPRHISDPKLDPRYKNEVKVWQNPRLDPRVLVAMIYGQPYPDKPQFLTA